MPPSVKFTPRSSLDSRIHSTVDGVLKEYKAASRQLQKISASFRLELELLDRLFYKNKNQHKSALFWRKVTEMRRFGHKLDRHKPDGLAEEARRWFWGPLSQQNPKMLKGSWTHCPDNKSLANAIKLLQFSQAMCDETSKRLMRAFDCFLLGLQSAAFAPLLVTFCAISARFNSQLHGIADLTLTCGKALARLLQKPALTSLCLNPPLVVPAAAPSKLLGDFDSAVEEVETGTGPPPPNLAVVFAPPPIIPTAEERRVFPVVRRLKQRPMDEIDKIFGF